MNDKIIINGITYIPESKATSIHDGMGYAVVRSRNQGVMCGYVESIDGQCVVLHAARQIWKYNSKFILVEVAEFGMEDDSESKLSVAMSGKCVMTEACGILYCTDVAKNNLIGIKAEDAS